MYVLFYNFIDSDTAHYNTIFSSFHNHKFAISFHSNPVLGLI